MKWCPLFNNWCSDVEEMIEEYEVVYGIECDLDCGSCDLAEDV